jgi:hypothetical protein
MEAEAGRGGEGKTERRRDGETSGLGEGATKGCQTRRPRGRRKSGASWPGPDQSVTSAHSLPLCARLSPPGALEPYGRGVATKLRAERA